VAGVIAAASSSRSSRSVPAADRTDLCRAVGSTRRAGVGRCAVSTSAPLPRRGLEPSPRQRRRQPQPADYRLVVILNSARGRPVFPAQAQVLRGIPRFARGGVAPPQRQSS
jgi:hypothetical protein